MNLKTHSPLKKRVMRKKRKRQPKLIQEKLKMKSVTLYAIQRRTLIQNQSQYQKRTKRTKKQRLAKTRRKKK